MEGWSDGVMEWWRGGAWRADGAWADLHLTAMGLLFLARDLERMNHQPGSFSVNGTHPGRCP